MALQFDPSTYFNAYRMGQQNIQQNRGNITGDISNLAQGIAAIQAQRRQQQLMRLQQEQQAQKMEMEKQKFASEYGTPISPNAMFGQETDPTQGPGLAKSSFMPGGMGQVGTGGSVLESFNKWRAGGMKPEGARPDFIGALGKSERETYQKQFAPQPQYVIPQQNPNGGGYIFTPLPSGSKPAPAPRLQSESQMKAPQGYRYRDDGSLEVIPGGPVEQSNIEKKQKEMEARNSRMSQAQLVMGKIDQAIEKLGVLTTGIGGSIMGKIPGSESRNLASDIETIKANLGFDQLAQMKAQSRAGASGMGQLSDNEMRLLVAARSNLDQAQGERQLRQRLMEVKQHYDNWLKMEDGINPYQQNEGLNNQQSPIVQRNKRTGKTRISYDGGQTWQIQ